MGYILGTWEFWWIIAVGMILAEMATLTHVATGFAISAFVISIAVIATGASEFWLIAPWVAFGILFWAVVSDQEKELAQNPVFLKIA